MGTWRGSVPLTVRILWRVELGSMQGASPIVDGLGNIYVAGIAALGGGHRLAKLNAAGMQQWAVSLGGSTRLRVPPAVRSDGQVVAIAEDSQWFVSVLRPETGRISAISSRFDLPPDRDEFIYRQHLTYSPPTLDRAGNIFIWHRVWQNEVDFGYNLTRFRSGRSSSFETTVVARFAQGLETSGTAFGRYDPAVPGPWPNPAAPALHEKCQDIVVIADRYGMMRVKPWGRKLHNKDRVYEPNAVLSGGGRAYVFSNTLRAFDQDGSQPWRDGIGGGFASSPPALGRGRKDEGDNSSVYCTRQETDRDHRGSRDYSADNVYVSAKDGTLYAIDYKGRLRWQVQIPRGRAFGGVPVVLGANGREIVVVANDAGMPAYLYGFDGAGAGLLWELELDSPVQGSPAVAGDRIFVATERSLYAIVGGDR
jgi:outer membrane protein assembly factor BamB